MSPLPHQSVAPAAQYAKAETLPPELLRLQRALGVTLIPGKPFSGYGGKPVIASVSENEPHKIAVNDEKRWNQASAQLLAHEMTHLLINQLAGPIRNAIPADDPNHPYDISNVDAMRSKGMKLWQLPQERAARIVQVYVADPSQRKRLQPWIDDLNAAPLSIMQPTGPDDKTINCQPRAPLPPVESYSSPTELLKEAKRRKP